MYHKKECVAMLLAGGQGSRLYTLTEKTAKPAVPFGGKYRIIDFPLSNCVNSGIDTVGVLTQYQPLELNEYIGNGQAWDLDRTFGGVMVLPPYQGNKSADWYKGTANAIYQNLAFIDRYDPEYVLVLSGDHIYKMDYAAMLDFHKKTEADCTIAVLNVTLEEASRFGIMNTDDNGKIYEFEEKPKHPKSTKASMGIYMFNYKKLKQYLIEDENTEGSANDFGKNIIPNMLAAGESMYAYPFSGYWKDVGTVSSLWEANMDLLGENPVFNLHDRSWRIFSRTSASPAQFIGENGIIDNALVSEGCEIMGTVKDSVLFNGVTVEEGATITNSVVMGGVTVKAGAVVNNVIIAENTTVGADATVGDGTKPGDNITILGSDLSIPDGMAIGGGLLVNAEKLNELVQKGGHRNMSTTGIIFSNLHDMSIADLTRKRTMASVPFGCRYRLIDFALSNMVNSGISDINVITHNNYRSLMDHLGSGKDWDLARRTGGLKVLPPFITAYSNDVNALYTSRLEALKSIQGVVAGITSDTVVLSDCDAICNVDLRKLIEYHNAENADVTFAVKSIPLTAQSSEHYNIVSSDDAGNITDIIAHKKGVEGTFDVSINIWVFKRQYLQSCLLDAAAHGYTSFTLDIIARSLNKQTFKVYRYDGFYANITSMADYYAINMSLLDPANREALFKIKERPIYTKVRNSAPTKYVDGAKVKNSLIADGCVIEGTVENSILFRGVRVGKNAVVKNAILFQDTQILSGAFVNCVIADKNVVVRNDVMLSGHPTMPLYIEKSKMI